jgi:hypothetical protein
MELEFPNKLLILYAANISFPRRSSSPRKQIHSLKDALLRDMTTPCSSLKMDTTMEIPLQEALFLVCRGIYSNCELRSYTEDGGEMFFRNVGS